MLMKWEDLEPGDEIELTIEAIREWKNWSEGISGVILKVISVMKNPGFSDLSIKFITPSGKKVQPI